MNWHFAYHEFIEIIPLRAESQISMSNDIAPLEICTPTIIFILKYISYFAWQLSKPLWLIRIYSDIGLTSLMISFS